jgi:hypothetical protein
MDTSPVRARRACVCRMPARADSLTRRSVSFSVHWGKTRRKNLLVLNVATGRGPGQDVKRPAPSPGLEPELSEPKSDVLPITPRRIDWASGQPRCPACPKQCSDETLVRGLDALRRAIGEADLSVAVCRSCRSGWGTTVESDDSGVLGPTRWPNFGPVGSRLEAVRFGRRNHLEFPERRGEVFGDPCGNDLGSRTTPVLWRACPLVPSPSSLLSY